MKLWMLLHEFEPSWFPGIRNTFIALNQSTFFQLLLCIRHFPRNQGVWRWMRHGSSPWVWWEDACVYSFYSTMGDRKEINELRTKSLSTLFLMGFAPLQRGNLFFMSAFLFCGLLLILGKNEISNRVLIFTRFIFPLAFRRLSYVKVRASRWTGRWSYCYVFLRTIWYCLFSDCKV